MIICRCLGLCLLICLACAAPARGGEHGPVPEAVTKAAFLVKFPAYVEWPAARAPAPGEPLVLGVLDDETLVGQLQALLLGLPASDHPLALRRLGPGDNLSGVHLVFAGGASPGAAALLKEAAGQGLLTVSDTGDAAPPAAMIVFERQDERLRFDIRLDVAQASGLKLSSRLLSVADDVHGLP